MRLFLCILVLIVILTPVTLAAGPILQPDPVNLVVNPGEVVKWPIEILDVTDLYGVDVRLKFDPAYIYVTELTYGSIPYPDFVVRNWVDNRAGTVWYALTQINPRLPFTGSGTVMTLTLTGIGSGTSALGVTIEAARRDGVKIPITAKAGQITVTGNIPPVSAPTPTTTATPTPTRKCKWCNGY
jgi:hypothetical protein